jgi:urease accessory protein UreH
VSVPTGSLAIAARRAGSRTIVERLRYEGISRCSRAFAEGPAARVVFSQLGPGVVRGDLTRCAGSVGAGAHLIVTQQSATRLMGGTRGASAHASWTLAGDALLELIGEPVVAATDARYDAVTLIALAAGAAVLITDVAQVSRGSGVRLRTSVRRDGRELWYDALEPAAAAPDVVGTFAIVGIAEEHRAQLVACLDRAADNCADVRTGVGSLRCGVAARVLARDVWAVRTALDELRSAVHGAIAGARAECPTSLPWPR